MSIPSGRFLFVILCAAAGLAACDTFPGTVKSGPTAAPAQTTAQVRPAPRLQTGDKAKIVVFGEDKLTGEHDIDPSGRIAMPLIGSIQAAGMTAKELERAVESRLRSAQILRAPEVTVSISTFRPFYVLGEVEKPGEYKYQNSLNVMSAAAVAGGFTYRASKSRVLIQRAGEKGFTEYVLTPDVPIYPGDLISVPERYF
jgi:protein involved in polysaccharide export with SLBB domain